MMRPNATWLVWGAGAVLALLLIAVGPAGLGATVDNALRHLRAHLIDLPAATVAVIRALAIALFVVFLGLSALVSRQGRPVGRTLVAVGGVFLLLTALPQDATETGGGLRWTGALVLCLVASVVMTTRVRR